MARKLDEIQNELVQLVATDSVLSTKLTSTSRVSVWRLIIYVVSFGIWVHEQIVEKNAENSRPHTKRWYREQAMNFIDGLELTWKSGQFQFDTTGMTPSQIEDAKPVTHCAITEAANGVLVIKTATENGSATVPLDVDVHGRFQDYMAQIKDAGNRLNYINTTADDLQLDLTVWVDPLVIDVNTGQLVDGTAYPVIDACNAYLNALEFNGVFVKTFLIDRIQQAVGVKVPRVEQLRHRAGINPYANVEEYVLPFSGHFKYQTINVIYKKYSEVA